jgi:transposase, IS6 family
MSLLSRSLRISRGCDTLAGYRFPPGVITLAVRWYLRFGLSYRDVEELVAERGIEVDCVDIYRWVQRFAPEFAEAARARQHVVGDRWHVDETYVRVLRSDELERPHSEQKGQVSAVISSFRPPHGRRRPGQRHRGELLSAS